MVRSSLDTWLTKRMAWTGDGVPSPAQLREWQLGKLRKLIAHAQSESPFYARHLNGIEPNDVRSVRDVALLPTLLPEQVSKAPEQMLCVSQDEIKRVVTLTSSGTTGRPKRIFHTASDLAATVEYFEWGMAHIVSPGEIALVLMPGDRPGGVGQLLLEALSRSGVRGIAHGVMDAVGAAIEHCLTHGVRCLVGSSAHVNMLACEWERRGLPKGDIHSVLLCWDAIPDAVARNVERAFGCRVYRHWGMIETGLGGAVECVPGSGMHLRETDVFMEIVDPESGAVLPDGEFGEMVVTTLLRRGMPLIRYRTGDSGRIIPGECDCGSPLRRLDSRIERKDAGIVLSGQKLTLSGLSEVVYQVDGVTDFCARYLDGMLRLVVCGEPSVKQRVMETLQDIPLIRSREIVLDIKMKNDGSPAVSGLGKRRIYTEWE